MLKMVSDHHRSRQLLSLMFQIQPEEVENTVKFYSSWYGRAFRLATTALLVAASASVASAQNKPNILVIWGDDIGQFNISAYNRGMMGYQTPNIGRTCRLRYGTITHSNRPHQSGTSRRA
jgi:hypothetical protein